MTDPLTDAELTEIEARAAAATPGPWRRGFGDGSGGACDEDNGAWITSDDRSGVIPSPVISGGSDDYQVPVGVRRGKDADFVAAARADVPALVAEIRRQRGWLEQIEQVGHNPADLAPDLCGHPERYRLLSDRLAGMAANALRGGDPSAEWSERAHPDPARVKAADPGVGGYGPKGAYATEPGKDVTRCAG